MDAVDRYTHNDTGTLCTGLDETLEFHNAAKTIKHAQGPNKAIGPDLWSEDGCRALAKQAATSFLGPAVQHLAEIESLLV